MQKLKDEAGVTSKKECVLELNDIVVRIVVMHKDCLQYPNLNFGLLVELRMILYYFYRDFLFLLMIIGPVNLPE